MLSEVSVQQIGKELGGRAVRNAWTFIKRQQVFILIAVLVLSNIAWFVHKVPAVVSCKY